MDGSLPGPSADLYALGVLIYELLTGTPPFHGSIAEVLGQHMIAQPAPLPESGWLGAMALRLLEKDPSARYPSAAAVIEANRQRRFARSAAGQDLTRCAHSVSEGRSASGTSGGHLSDLPGGPRGCLARGPQRNTWASRALVEERPVRPRPVAREVAEIATRRFAGELAGRIVHGLRSTYRSGRSTGTGHPAIEACGVRGTAGGTGGADEAHQRDAQREARVRTAAVPGGAGAPLSRTDADGRAGPARPRSGAGWSWE